MAAYREHPINARTLPHIIAERVPNPWSIDQLHEALNDPRTDLMKFGSCRVLDLYCYLRAGNQSHEFLLARILLDQRDVWARLERQPDTSARSPLSGRSGYPALDQIRLSNSDNRLKTPRDKLDVHCGFPSLRLYHLVDCVKFVHDETFNYEWDSTNCWWFSSIIVETLHVYGEYHRKPHKDVVKRLVSLFGKDTTDARRRIGEKFRAKWTDYTTVQSDLSTARGADGSFVKKLFSKRRTSMDGAADSLLSSTGPAPRLPLRLLEDIEQDPVPSTRTETTILHILPQSSDNVPTSPTATPLPPSPVGGGSLVGSEDESQRPPTTKLPQGAPPPYADMSIQRWAKKKPAVYKLSWHAESIYCIDVASDKIVTGSRDKCIKVWSSISCELLATLRGHAASVLCMKADAADGFLASGSSDGELLIWNLGNLDNTSPVHKISAHHENVLGVALSPEYIISSGKDKTVKIWSRKTFGLIWSSVGHGASVNAVDISLASNRIVSASSDKTLVLWQISTEGLSQLRTFRGHTGGAACVRFLPLSDAAQATRSSQSIFQSTNGGIHGNNEDIFASGGKDMSIRIWRANTGECIRILEGHTDLVRDLAYDASVELLVSGSRDSTVVFWRLRLVDYLSSDPAQPNDSGSGEKLRVLTGYRDKVFGVAIDRHRIICVGAAYDGYIFDFS